ncbi:MAG: cysteine hydrolase family protein [Pseudomonadota bacterium]
MNTQPCLLLVDVQSAFDDGDYWGPRNNPDAEQQIAVLLAFAREQQWPVVHVRHASLTPGSPLQQALPGFAFKPEAAPIAGEPVYTKHVNSGFIGTTLEQDLRRDGIEQLVVAGLTTDHCVSTTVRMAANLGFDVRLVADACATHDRTDLQGQACPAAVVHRLHLASLNGEFCEVINTEAVVNSR